MGEFEQEPNEGSTACDLPWLDGNRVLLRRVTVIVLFVLSLIICGLIAVAALALPKT